MPDHREAPAKSQLPARDCTPRALPRAARSGRHVGLRPPRNDKSVCLAPLNYCCNTRNCLRRSGSAATDAIGPCILSTPCTNCKCLPEIAPQGHFLALRAQGATSAYGLLAMTNRGPSAILTIACTGCKCVAGSGMPLPYNFPRDLLLSLYTAAAFFSTAAAVFFRRDLRFRPFCDNIRGRY